MLTFFKPNSGTNSLNAKLLNTKDCVINTSKRAQELDFEVFEGNLLSSNDRIYADMTRYNKCVTCHIGIYTIITR
jgi:hypothetical protein